MTFIRKASTLVTLGILLFALNLRADARSFTLSSNPASFTFSATAGGSAVQQSLAVTSSGRFTRNFSVRTDQTWITVGATSGNTVTPTMVGANASGLAAGTYTGHVIVHNSQATDSTLSVPVTFVVKAAVSSQMIAPSITSQPSSQTVTMGQSATFSVAASGTGPLHYQWTANNTMISGATAPTYTTAATTSGYNGEQVAVTVSNSAGTATSNAATITLAAVTPAPPPTTKTLSASQSSLSFGSVNIGSNGALSVTYTNTGTATVTISSVSVTGAGLTSNGVSAGLILAPSQSATLNVTFTPASTGSVTGKIAVASDATNSPSSINVTATGIASVSHSVSLTWSTETVSVAGYNVYRGTQSSGPFTKINGSLNTLPNFMDTPVSAGQYYYAVTAVDNSNTESAYSSPVSALVP